MPQRLAKSQPRNATPTNPYAPPRQDKKLPEPEAMLRDEPDEMPAVPKKIRHVPKPDHPAVMVMPLPELLETSRV